MLAHPRIGLVVGLTLLLSAGCSSGSPKVSAGVSSAVGSAVSESASSPTAALTPSAESPTPSASSIPQCDGTAYTRIAASDGTSLGVVELGAGPRGVLMLPQHDASACGWDVEATGLVAAGYHVMLLEYRCTVVSDCPDNVDAQSQLSLDAAAGIAALRARGATKVIVVGASAGGTLAVVAGAAAGSLINGVVDLSGPADVSFLYGNIAGRVDSLGAAPHLAVPSLFVVSQDDPSTTVGEITAVYNAVPNTSKKLLVLPPEGGHGWDTLGYAGPEGDVQGDLYAFLKSHD